MKKATPTSWQTICPETYYRIAEAQTVARYGKSILEISAETFIRAGQQADYSPTEIVAWLAAVDGL